MDDGTRNLPTDRQDTDGFIRPEVQHPDKRFHLKHADAMTKPGANRMQLMIACDIDNVWLVTIGSDDDDDDTISRKGEGSIKIEWRSRAEISCKRFLRLNETDEVSFKTPPMWKALLTNRKFCRFQKGRVSPGQFFHTIRHLENLGRVHRDHAVHHKYMIKTTLKRSKAST